MSTRENIFAKISELLSAAINRGEYASQVNTVSRAWIDILNMEPSQFPCVEFIDPGLDRLTVSDSSADRFSTEMIARCSVKCKSRAEMLSDLNTLTSDVRTLLAAEPVLDANQLQCRYSGTDESLTDGDTFFGVGTLRAKLIYVESVSRSIAVPVILGEKYIDNATEAVVDLFESLNIGSVYPRHRVADLRLPAITVAVANDRSEEQDAFRGRTHHLQFTARIHTEYEQAAVDDTVVQQYMQTMINKIAANLSLTSQHTIVDEISGRSGVAFAESDSSGGEISFTVQTKVAHTQES